MDRLEKELNKEQVEQITEDIKKARDEKKEEFCKVDYMSLQDAKTKLMIFITKIIMNEAGFIID